MTERNGRPGRRYDEMTQQNQSPVVTDEMVERAAQAIAAAWGETWQCVCTAQRGLDCDCGDAMTDEREAYDERLSREDCRMGARAALEAALPSGVSVTDEMVRKALDAYHGGNAVFDKIDMGQMRAALEAALPSGVRVNYDAATQEVMMVQGAGLDVREQARRIVDAALSPTQAPQPAPATGCEWCSYTGYQADGETPCPCTEPTPAPDELEIDGYLVTNGTIGEWQPFDITDGDRKAGFTSTAMTNHANAQSALRAERERLEREIEQAENDEQEWMEKATYEVGAVPHLWSDRAKAAEARVADLEKALNEIAAPNGALNKRAWMIARAALKGADHEA